jgi:ketose-bisphosphate aldolase
MKITMHQLLQWADEEKFGVIAFNYSDIWDLLGVIKAAEQENAPIMVMATPPVVNTIGVKYLYGMSNAAVEAAKVPVVTHLDHSYSKKMCYSAVDCGYKSIMIDASNLALADNIYTTKAVVDYAHRFDCFVEGELGQIRGSNWEGIVTDESKPFLTEVDDAVRFVSETRVDSLAVGIGNAHGFYTETPKLNIKRLAEINEAVDTKLVLHGGTGIPAETVRDAINNGINKINVGTIIFNTHMKTLKASLNAQEGFDLQQHNAIIDEVAKVASEWIRVSMSNGKA